MTTLYNMSIVEHYSLSRPFLIINIYSPPHQGIINNRKLARLTS